MTWKYRIVQYADGSGFGLHEVYYNSKSEPGSMTAAPAGFVSETRDEIYKELLKACASARHLPVFVEPPDWE